jgi:hypothetical protein
MKLDKTKLQEIVEKIAYQQTAEEQSDDLFNKMGILNEYVQEQLALTDVSQQRELLLAYEDYLNEYHTKEDRIKQVDKYLKANNCLQLERV